MYRLNLSDADGDAISWWIRMDDILSDSTDKEITQRR